MRSRAAVQARVRQRLGAGLACILTLHPRFGGQGGVTERLVGECPIRCYEHEDGGRGIYE
jgi:hypothetical protein